MAANKNAHNFRHRFTAVFHFLSHGGIHFVPTVSSKNFRWQFMIGCWRSLTHDEVVTWANNLNKMESQHHEHQELGNLFQNRGVRSWLHFCFWQFETFECFLGQGFPNILKILKKIASEATYWGRCDWCYCWGRSWQRKLSFFICNQGFVLSVISASARNSTSKSTQTFWGLISQTLD